MVFDDIPKASTWEEKGIGPVWRFGLLVYAPVAAVCPLHRLETERFPRISMPVEAVSPEAAVTDRKLK
jgi:hypothetical protein